MNKGKRRHPGSHLQEGRGVVVWICQKKTSMTLANDGCLLARNQVRPHFLVSTLLNHSCKVRLNTDRMTGIDSNVRPTSPQTCSSSGTSSNTPHAMANTAAQLVRCRKRLQGWRQLNNRLEHPDIAYEKFRSACDVGLSSNLCERLQQCLCNPPREKRRQTHMRLGAGTCFPIASI